MFSWETLLEVIAVLIILSHFLNVYAGLAGIGMCVTINPLQLLVAKEFAKIRKQTAAQTDSRIRHMSEVVNSISSVKSFNWENPFYNLISLIRQQECSFIKESQHLRSINAALYFCSPHVSIFACFTVYHFTGGVITVPKVFSAMSLFQVLRISIGSFWTKCMETSSESFTSCSRIQAFLDLGTSPVPPPPATATPATPVKEESAIEMVALPLPVVSHNSSCVLHVPLSHFKHKDATRHVLQNINFSVNSGELVLVIGPVGSGKSSLLSAILGNLLPTEEGRQRYLKEDCRIAYCAQTPWILAASVRANICLADKELTSSPTSGREERGFHDFKCPTRVNIPLYERTVKCCRLVSDFKMWPDSDRTEIGERVRLLTTDVKD